MTTLRVENVVCPKCGCPPRSPIGVFNVRVRLLPTSRGYELGKEKRVLESAELVYDLECGGGHRWLSEPMGDQDE